MKRAVNRFNKFVEKIDFPGLRKQRALLRALMENTDHDRRRHELSGLASLLDDLCDESAKVLDEKTVFGKSKNENCLAGIKCPNCGNENGFGIASESTFSVSDDGTDDHGDVEWTGTSWIQCDKCEHGGEMWEFQA